MKNIRERIPLKNCSKHGILFFIILHDTLSVLPYETNRINRTASAIADACTSERCLGLDPAISHAIYPCKYYPLKRRYSVSLPATRICFYYYLSIAVFSRTVHCATLGDIYTTCRSGRMAHDEQSR